MALSFGRASQEYPYYNLSSWNEWYRSSCYVGKKTIDTKSRLAYEVSLWCKIVAANCRIVEEKCANESCEIGVYSSRSQIENSKNKKTSIEIEYSLLRCSPMLLDHSITFYSILATVEILWPSEHNVWKKKLRKTIATLCMTDTSVSTESRYPPALPVRGYWNLWVDLSNN